MKLLQAAVKQLAEECDGMGQGMGGGGPTISPNGLMSFMVGRNRAEEEEGTGDERDMENDHGNEEDVVSMDVPLLIRMMELSREEIKDDATLHHVAKKMIDLSAKGETLSMNNYEEIISNLDLASHDEEDDMGGEEEMPSHQDRGM